MVICTSLVYRYNILRKLCLTILKCHVYWKNFHRSVQNLIRNFLKQAAQRFELETTCSWLKILTAWLFPKFNQSVLLHGFKCTSQKAIQIQLNKQIHCTSHKNLPLSLAVIPRSRRAQTWITLLLWIRKNILSENTLYNYVTSAWRPG